MVLLGLEVSVVVGEGQEVLVEKQVEGEGGTLSAAILHL